MARVPVGAASAAIRKSGSLWCRSGFSRDLESGSLWCRSGFSRDGVNINTGNESRLKPLLRFL